MTRRQVINLVAVALSDSRRICIIGGPGSGKSTLAQALAADRRILATDLDAVRYAGGVGAERSAEDRDRDVAEILQREHWIVEGIYLGFCRPLFEAADTIVFLDVSCFVGVWRVIIRHVKSDLSRTNRHPGYRKLFRFLRFVRHYYKASVDMAQKSKDPEYTCRALALKWFEEWPDKVVIVVG